MTHTLSEHTAEDWAEINVFGRVGQVDMLRLFDRLDGLIRPGRTLRIVEVIADFEGYEADAIWPGMADQHPHLARITHTAVVCDKGWLGPVSRAVGSTSPVTIRTFSSHDRDAARAWIAAP